MRYVLLILFSFYFQSYCQTDTLSEYKRAVSLSAIYDGDPLYSVSFKQNFIKNNYKYFFEFGMFMYAYDNFFEHLTYSAYSGFTFRISRQFPQLIQIKKDNIRITPELSVIYWTNIYKDDIIYEKINRWYLPSDSSALSIYNDFYIGVNLNLTLYDKVALIPELQYCFFAVDYFNINSTTTLMFRGFPSYFIGSISIAYLF